MYGAIIFFQELLSESILLKQVLLEQILLRQILPEYVGTDASEQMWREVREKMELEIKDVIHTYPNKKTALNRISLTLTPGIYGLLGPNGAGKSTLMKIITGNMQPSSGKVLFNGSDIKELGRAYRDRLGYMPQQQGLYNQFTGRRFLWYMATLKGLSHREAKYKIDNLLEQMNLTEVADRKIGGYSGGMKQRLLIAQAVMNSPDILVLDEPTAGLDPKERINIRNFVSEMSRECIVIFATHVVSDVECIAKEMILIKRGEIVRQDEVPKLIAEMDGLVWEFVAQENEVVSIQKEYLVSNLSVGKEGIIVRAVGTDEEIKREKHAVRAGMEEVYLYHMTVEAKREKDK